MSDDNQNSEENSNTVTVHVGTAQDEMALGDAGIDVMDMGGGNDTVAGGGGLNIVLGGSGDDVVIGSGSTDVVLGGGGSDLIYAGGGAQAIVRGGTGNDAIYGGNTSSEDDVLLGDEGDDMIKGHAGTDIIYGGADQDMLYGGSGIDLVYGGTGNDEIYGGDHLDLLVGGEGNDTIDGGAGDDFIIGGAGDDELTGGTGADTFIFGSGDGFDTITDFDTANDRIDLTSFDQSIAFSDLMLTAVEDENGARTGTMVTLPSAAGGGSIVLEGVTSNDDVTADMFDLPVIGNDEANTLTGGTGDDRIVGGDGNDSLTGGDGADWFEFGAGHGDDTITDFDTDDDIIDLSALSNDAITFDDLSITQSGNDTVIDLSSKGGGSITLTGVTSTDLTADHFDLPDGGSGDLDNEESIWHVLSTGNDTLDAGGGHDVVFAEEGDDEIDGGTGSDWIFGGEGNDSIDGGGDGDNLFGGEGNDTIDGGAGDDLFVAGEGDDSLTGGTGADTFFYESGHGNDTITDFTADEDTIDLSLIGTITSFDDLDIGQSGADAVIDLTDHGGGTLTLEDVTAGALDADDFRLYDAAVGGTGGADDLEGRSGDDVITGGAGNDTLTGDMGADTFVFAANHGTDTITDFNYDEGEGDVIDLTAFTGITEFSGLTTRQEGDDVVIDLTGETGGGTITLEDFDLNDLDAEQFVLYDDGI